MRAARLVKKMPDGASAGNLAELPESARVVDHHAIVVARGKPDGLAARREFHVQHGLARLQGLHHLAAEGVDHLHPAVVGEGEVDPDLAPVRAGHDEHRLALDRDAAGFLPGRRVGHQHLVAADRRQPGAARRDRPAAQVGHLEHRQLFLAATVFFEDLARALFRLPEVEQGDAVLAEQAGQVVAAIGRHQSVVGLLAGRIALRHGFLRIGEIADPDLAAIEQA
jgi:hypothetical protein